MKSKNLYLLKNFSNHEVRAYYNTPLLSLKEFLRQINLNNNKLKKIEALLHGTFQSTTFGTGFDFNEIREYKTGDDLRHISWSATARTGNLHTKEYFTEKEVRSYFLIDISNSMFCGNKLDPFLQSTVFLLNMACGFSEKIGGIFFSDEIKYNFPLAAANTQANIIFQTLINYINNLNEKITTTPSNTNLFKALDFTKQYFRKKGMIFIISDLVNIERWEKIIYETAQKHNIYLFQIYDPIDFSLTKAGYITIVDPETNKRLFVNTDSKIIHESYVALMNTRQEKLKTFLKTIGVKHIVIEKTDFD